ncbi:LysM peptidoglycan-binding domain-containing protein [Corticibacterium sp. UT-5YL-CI-8]|nr:LysM peptidoglycan-binding domain-containing protein [Tianweitania sp. UT-5YL-CI-8]
MAMTAGKGLLFGAGVIIAAGAVAYYSGAFHSQPEPASLASVPAQPATAAPAPASNSPAPAAPSSPAAPAAPVTPTSSAAVPAPAVPVTNTAPAAPGTTAQAPAQQQATPEIVPPSFDVVRAEGDGSLVIAGKAAPNAQVEVMKGSAVLGNATAGPSGDFAVVLDNPLAPGDYQLVLRATNPDKTVAMSPETAVVSIPDSPSGQVLALVEQAGKPSELITVPQAPEPAAEAPVVAQPQAPGVPANADSQAQAAAPAPQPAAPAQAAATGPKVSVEAVEIEGDKIFVAGIADPDRRVRAYANEVLLGDAIASPDGRFLIEQQRRLPVGDYIIRVDALDKDGASVIARAAVPFEREPGEQVSAVAAPTSTAPAPSEAPANARVAAAHDTATAAKLQPASGAVIIRKGDSLWRISRRVYGQGVRYSNIYIANQPQIQNPHKIWPGQVFKVPTKTDDGTDADMKALKDQATTVQ